MVGYDEIILSIVAFIGSAGIIGASLTYYFDKRKQIKFSEQKEKEKRYLAIVIQMRIVVEPDQMKYFKHLRPDLVTLEDWKNEVRAEWFNLFTFCFR